jgi:hypothetical protein
VVLYCATKVVAAAAAAVVAVSSPSYRCTAVAGVASASRHSRRHLHRLTESRHHLRLHCILSHRTRHRVAMTMVVDDLVDCVVDYCGQVALCCW